MNFVRNVEIFRQLVHLGFVQVGDGFEVGCSVAILDEESLVVLQTVGGTYDGVVEAISVIVFDHLPRALLEIAGGYDAQESFSGEPGARFNSSRGPHDNRRERIGRSIQKIWQHDLALVPIVVFLDHLVYGAVAPLITTIDFQNGANVFEHSSYPKKVREKAGPAGSTRSTLR